MRTPLIHAGHPDRAGRAGLVERAGRRERVAIALVAGASLLALGAAGCASDDASRRSREPIEPVEAAAEAEAGGKAGKPELGVLAPDMAAPYFNEGVAGKAAARFELASEPADWKAARDGFAAARKALADTAGNRETRARLALLVAVCDAELRRWEPAGRGFANAVRALPLLADWANYQAARAFYFAHNLDAALAHARAVRADPADSADSIVGADAELLVGDILRSRGMHAQVARHYADYLAKRPDGIRRTEARYRLAEAEHALGKTTAAANYRKVVIAAPLSAWAGRAEKQLDALRAGMSEAERAAFDALSADELIERGMAYYEAMRNPLSEADFEAALTAPGLTDATRCVAAYYRANSIFKARQYERAAPRFDEAFAACEAAAGAGAKAAGDNTGKNGHVATSVDLQIKAAYQAGRSYAYARKHKDALARYRDAEAVAKRHDHSFADDALLRQAEEWALLGNDAKVTAALSALPDRYPDGDMRAEALWRLGWRAFSEKRYDEAIRWLDKQIAAVPLDTNYWAEGQAQYWLGRAHAARKQPAKAVAAYRDAVRKYPLSYYALLALNRLRDDHPRAFADVQRELETPPAGWSPDAPAFEFAPRPEYASEAFARGMEFLRLGLEQPAAAELSRLGLTPPAGRSEVTDADQRERLWAMAFLYDRAGLYGQSHWVTRWHVLDYKRSWPVGANLARWKIAYPKAWWKLLDTHATKHGFPTELLIAIVREESAFNPLMESYANAIGLTQMIFPTAERFGKGTGIDITRTNLRDPENNVTIGSRFLAFLWNKWDGHVPLIPPSYNAGEGAAARWLRARGTLPADEWIESIAGDQARNYSKRVIASYFAYSYIYKREIPVVPNTIAKSALDTAEKMGPKRRAAKAKPARGKKQRGNKRR